MLFNSFEFIFIFLPLALFGFFAVARFSHRAALAWLALASIVFYGYWNPRFVFLLLGSIFGNYALGRLIEKAPTPRLRKRLLVLAITLNLTMLAVFKYANFFITTVDSVTGAGFGVLDIALPLGISFFTFTQITYLVDTYRGQVQEHDIVSYMLFVTYFPHLIAGPLLHHQSVMPQFSTPDTFRIQAHNVVIGLTIFSVGLAKKVLLADRFSGFASPIFDAAAAGFAPETNQAWQAALAYTLQLDFDFSGYSDMAIGLSKMFGINIPVNFNSPYKALNIADFWRRWHMSLSQFLRDYLYIPLGGNQHGPSRRYANLLATMLLGGLWHGAGMTFVLWGLIHGLYLAAYHWWRSHLGQGGASLSTRTSRATSCLLTFLLVVIAWVMFRAANVETALTIYQSMLGLNVPGAQVAQIHWNFRFSVLLCAALALVWLAPNTQTLFLDQQSPAVPTIGRAWKYASVTAFGSGLLLMATLYYMSVQKNSEFIYFQF